MSKQTPWGPSQSARHIGEGIFSHSTAGHGGLYVPPAKLAEMPAALRCNVYAGGGSWFEEDCEWALVCLAFPYLFTNYQIWLAGQTLKNSDTYREASLWLHLEAGEQVAAMVEDFGRDHAKDFHLGCMSSSGNGWDCMANTLDGSERIRFFSKDWPKVSAPFTRADLLAAGVAEIKEEVAA